MTDNTTVINFTVKELLLELRQELSNISAKLDGKADKSDVVNLLTRVSALEQDKHSRDTHQDRKRWFVPVATGIGMSLASPFLWLLVAKLR